MCPSARASSHAITSDIGVLETMKAAEFFQSDGVVLTGGATGQPPSVGELQGAHLWNISALKRSKLSLLRSLLVNFTKPCIAALGSRH